jgi:PAS domain S-box-containing protein
MDETDKTNETAGFQENIKDETCSLSESEKRLKSIFKAAPIGIGVVSDRILTEVNSRICEMTGYTNEELIGSSARILYPTDADYEYVGTEKYRQISENGTGTVETKWLKKDGTIIDVLLSSTPIDINDLKLGVTFTALDISERKKTETTLKESEEKFRTLVSGMQQGLAVHEIITNDSGKVTDYRFLDANDSFERITGLKKEKIIGRTVLEVLPETEHYWIEQYGQVALTGEPLFYENYSRELGRYYEVVAYRPRHNQFATIITDVTDRKKAEEIHKLQGERDKAIIDTLPDMLFVVDREGYCTEAHLGENAKTSIPIENLIGSNIKEVFPAEEARRYIEICNKCIDSGKLHTVEYYLKIDGKKSYFEARLSPIYNNQVLAIIRDITESKNFRDTLTTIAETGFEYGDDILRVLVRQLAISQDISTAFLAEYCTGEGDSEKGCTVAVWSHGKYKEEFDFKIEGTLCENVILNGEWLWPSKVQQLYPDSKVLRDLKAESYWGISLKNDSGETIGILAIIDDKPMERSEHLYSILSSFASRAAAEMERRKAEEMLVSATHRLFLATKSANMGIWEWDFKTNILIWDKKMHEIYGTEPIEFTGEFEFWKEKVHPDDIENALKEIDDAVSGIKEFKTEFRIITPNNETRFIEAHGMVERDLHGTPLKLIGANWDITDRKIVEEALIYSRIISEDTNRIKSEFMNNVSHELRTPLTSVIGFSDVLLQEDYEGLSKEQKKYVEYINSSGKNLLDIINKIIDFSRYEINDPENLNIKKITLDSFISEIMMLISKKAADKSIGLSFKRKESVGTFYADEHKLTQIIHNLLENAVKFTNPGGSITVETSAYGGMLRISVIDTGIGIDKDDMNEIFKPFLQLDGSIARKYNGTGIGLALCKKLVELHDGNMWVASEPGNGSNFTFEIPVDPYLDA